MLTVYKASAGSGKTYTLAKTYITLLLGIKNHATGQYELNLDREGGNKNLLFNNRHRRILAITFTRKATEEMKTRIVKELESLAAAPTPGEKEKSNYASSLTAELKCSRSELSLAAEIALRQLLFDYQNFNVSTIDAFFQRVLHTFARELDRQTDYSVELNDEAAMRAAVSAMLDDFNVSNSAGSPLEDWLYDFMESRIDDGLKANFFNRRSDLHTDLVKQVAQISRESFKPYVKAMEAYLSDDLNPHPFREFHKELMRYMKDLRKSVQADALAVFGADQAISPSSLKTAKAQKNVADMMEGKLVDVDFFTDTAYMRAMTDPESDASAFKKGQGSDEQSAVVRDFFIRVYKKHQLLQIAKGIRESMTQIGLLRFAWGYLKQFTQENNVLLISDTNQLLERIIGKDPTPFIYERMGLQLKHFLIDEFQDTSQMQWRNLCPLVENSLAGDEDEGRESDNDSLVIGDEKQSIYRFRNSDSSILHSGIQEHFGDNAIQKGHERSENTNYRSSADVVRFNNTFFSIFAEQWGITGFENVVQDIKEEHKGYRGYVRFIPTSVPVPGKENAQDIEQEVFEDMANQIKRMVHEGGYDFKDIAILLDTNKFVAKVVDFLIENYAQEIPVLSDEALFLNKSWAVQLVISVLRIIDAEQSGETIKSHPFATRAQALEIMNRFQYFVAQPNLAYKESEGDENTIEPCDALEMAIESVGQRNDSLQMGVDAIRAKRPSTLVALIEAVIQTQFPDIEARSTHSAYLAALQDVAIEFAANANASLHSFLSWWDDNSGKLTIGGASDTNAVRVMTIHKSKGLEFPCVLLPMCKWSMTWDNSPKKLPRIWTAALSEKGMDGLNTTFAPPALNVKLDKSAQYPCSPFKDVYEEERKKALSDMLNKTYVAFTRAEAELIVWYETKDASALLAQEECTHIGNAISRVFAVGYPSAAHHADLLTHLEADEEGLTIGEPTKKRLRDEKKKPREAMNLVYEVINRDDAAPFAQIDDGEELERDIDDSLPLSVSSAEAMMKGNIMHEIMANIVEPSDFDRAVAMVAAKWRLSAADINDCKSVISDFLADIRVANWFGGFKKVLVEAPIYIPNADAVRRPDRIIIQNDGSVDVIDYKFGISDHSEPEHHRKQVRNYMMLLSEIYGCKVRGYLCYPRIGAIHQVNQ